MTTGRKFKHKVRERMERTGESYTAALHALKAERPALEAPVARYAVRVVSGGTTTDAAHTDSFMAALEAAKVALSYKQSSAGKVDVYDSAVDAAVCGYDEKGQFWELDEL